MSDKITYKKHPTVNYWLVGTNGTIYSIKNNRFITGTKTNYGYIRITELKGRKRFLHRIIMETYYGHSDLDIDHIDGNKENNNINNLEYVTTSENVKRAIKMGLRVYKKKSI